jgi:ribosomal protein L11 methyltransferase
MADLVRSCAAFQGCDRRSVRSAVGRLVAAGELQYCQCLGCTFVEIAWSRLRRVSPRILLCTENVAPAKTAIGPDAVVVRLGQGAAFGGGDHVTTRLALAAMDTLFADALVPAAAKVLDIGTGTGVLAIAAVALGAASAVALDTDPCARWEARRNAEGNRFSERIRVLADPVETIGGQFDLILANLRLPTLLRLTETIGQRLNADGVVVVSGIRPEESDALVAAYGRLSLKRCWYEQRQEWAGIGFSRSVRRV